MSYGGGGYGSRGGGGYGGGGRGGYSNGYVVCIMFLLLMIAGLSHRGSRYSTPSS
jgi:hypothetical protein